MHCSKVEILPLVDLQKARRPMDQPAPLAFVSVTIILRAFSAPPDVVNPAPTVIPDPSQKPNPPVIEAVCSSPGVEEQRPW